MSKQSSSMTTFSVGISPTISRFALISYWTKMMRTLHIFALLTICLVGCKDRYAILKGMPKLDYVGQGEFKKEGGVPSLVYHVDSAVIFQAIEEYDSLLSKQWARFGSNVEEIRACNASPDPRRICGGSISWGMHTSKEEVVMVVIGYPRAKSWLLSFRQFKGE